MNLKEQIIIAIDDMFEAVCSGQNISISGDEKIQIITTHASFTAKSGKAILTLTILKEENKEKPDKQ